jgi:anti-anti-sigma regulatory factor
MTSGRQQDFEASVDPHGMSEVTDDAAETDAPGGVRAAAWPFAVQPLIDENLTSLKLTGEIDCTAQAELDRVLEAAIEARSKLLLVDVSRAEFVSTAAMLSIVTAARHVGRVLIYRPNSATRRIFRLIDPEGLCQSIA